MPAEPSRGSANVGIAQGKGTGGKTERDPEPGDGRGKQTGDRRTKGNQRTAGEGGEPGGQTGSRRKARRGKPEAVRSGPRPPGESPGIWGRTHLRCRWRGPGEVGRAARLAPAQLAPPGPAGSSDARRGLARAAGCVWWIRDQSTVSGGWEYVPAGWDAHLVPGVCRPLTEVGRIRIQNGCAVGHPEPRTRRSKVPAH